MSEYEQSSEASGEAPMDTFPLVCREGCYQAYKRLIHDLADHLGKEDVAAIVFNQNLPSSMEGTTALGVLNQLERQGVYSQHTLQPLADLLQGINRNDLVNKQLDDFRRLYGRSQQADACNLAIAPYHTLISLDLAFLQNCCFKAIQYRDSCLHT